MPLDEQSLVSVIIPAYNAERTLGSTLASALAQTYPHLEVIVVDDGSTDRTADVAAAWAARDPRVRLSRQSNAGVAAARNLGLARAAGTFFAPLDADDLWHPDKITLQMKAMRSRMDAPAVVWTLYRLIDGADRIIADPMPGHLHDGDVYAALVLSNFIACASIPLVRRTAALEVGGYDTGLLAQRAQGCEDLKLYLALAERHTFAVVPQYLVGYRQARSSISRDVPQMMRSMHLVIEEVKRKHPELPDFLFLWSLTNVRTYGVAGYLRTKQRGCAISLLLEVARDDPAWFLLVARARLRRLGNWLRGEGSRGNATTPRQKFGDAHPWQHAGADPAARASLARERRVALMRIERARMLA
jgi:glycosyltransferase involved in cell wall biosynthesis